MHLYTPILQSKEGELTALNNLLLADKAKIIPLIQLLPDIKVDRVNNYVTERVKPLIAGWSFLDNRIYIDPISLGLQNLQVTKSFFEKLSEGRVNIIPVIYPDTASELMEFFGDYTLHGICLRIKGDDVLTKKIDGFINRCKDYFSLFDNEIDVLIDFSVITSANETHFYNSFENVYERSTQIKSIRKLMISSGSFPADLSQITKDTVMALPRIEWKLWQRIKSMVATSVPLVYADYGNVHPVYDIDTSQRRGTCSIKYTDTDSFYVFKGVRPTDSPIGNVQYQKKAADLLTKPYYSGNAFSWGDQYISDCVETREGPGNSTTWVKVTQNHHFVKMLYLLKG